MNLQFARLREFAGSQGKNYSRRAKILDSICLISFCGQETREDRIFVPIAPQLDFTCAFIEDL